MISKTNIITEYPYSPIFVETLGEYYYVRYLSEWYNAETNSFLKYKILPKWMKSPYNYLKSQTFLLYLLAIRKSKYYNFRNIFWFTHVPPLMWKGKVADKIKSSKLGHIIFNFSDDPIIQSKYLGEKLSPKIERDFNRGLNKILPNCTSIWMHENRLKGYQEKGFEISDPIVIPNAGNPELFKATPLPKEKIIAFIASVIGDKKIYDLRNIPLLINAFRIVQKKHPDAKLLISGPMTAEIKKLIMKDIKGLNVTINTEWVPYSEVHKIFESAYMIIRPHKKMKIFYKILGSSQQSFDAAAAARPLISVDIKGGIPEDIKTIWCDFTPEDMAEKMCRLLDDRKYAEKIGKANRLAIEKKHSWEHRAKKLYDHIKDKV